MSLKKNILEKIKKEHIEPISHSIVLRQKYLMIVLFLLLIGLGIFIVSFFLTDISWLSELVEMDTIYMIFIWIVAILALSLFVYRDSRNIGTLYRYSMGKVLATILVIMVAWGSLLYFLGLDHSIQRFLIRHTGYEQVMSTYRNWSKPEQGRLIGEIKEVKENRVVLIDFYGKDWTIILSGKIMKQKDTDNEEIIEGWNIIKITGKLQGNDIFIGENITLLFE